MLGVDDAPRQPGQRSLQRAVRRRSLQAELLRKGPFTGGQGYSDRAEPALPGHPSNAAWLVVWTATSLTALR